MNLQELPDWVWQLIVDLQFYEDTHPPLYRMNDDVKYERAKCPSDALTGIPREVYDAAQLLSSKGVVVPGFDYTEVAGS